MRSELMSKEPTSKFGDSLTDTCITLTKDRINEHVFMRLTLKDSNLLLLFSSLFLDLWTTCLFG